MYVVSKISHPQLMGETGGKSNIAEYMKWVAQDGSRGRALAFAIESRIDSVNQGKQRLSHLEALRTKSRLEMVSSTGRRLVVRWAAAIPVDKWADVRPDEPIPAEEHPDEHPRPHPHR